MKYHKKLLIKGATFINSSGNKCEIVDIDSGYSSCKLKHPSGIFDHDLNQVVDYLNIGKYTKYKSNLTDFPRIKDLPKPIAKLSLEKETDQYAKEYSFGNVKNKLVKLFDWEKTDEGYDFWNEIYNGNFTPFIEKYPESLDILDF